MIKEIINRPEVKADIKQALQDGFKMEVWEYGKNLLILKKQAWLVVDDIYGHIETNLIKAKFQHVANITSEGLIPVIKCSHKVILASILTDDITLSIAEERLAKGHKLAVWKLKDGYKTALVDETRKSCISGSWVKGLKTWERLFEVADLKF